MSERHGAEENVQGESAGDAQRDGEGGGGGAHGDESFTMGGARGRDAERGEYYEPDDEDDKD